MRKREEERKKERGEREGEKEEIDTMRVGRNIFGLTNCDLVEKD